MNPKTVHQLEEHLEPAIAKVLMKMGLKQLPLLPSHKTIHLMAKAAVAVYEGAVENKEGVE